jgi:hypothetical protein
MVACNHAQGLVEHSRNHRPYLMSSTAQWIVSLMSFGIGGKVSSNGIRSQLVDWYSGSNLDRFGDSVLSLITCEPNSVQSPCSKLSSCSIRRVMIPLVLSVGEMGLKCSPMHSKEVSMRYPFVVVVDIDTYVKLDRLFMSRHYVQCDRCR